MQIHTATLKIRVSPAIVEKARVRAQSEGVSFSEWMRSAMRRELREAA